MKLSIFFCLIFCLILQKTYTQNINEDEEEKQKIDKLHIEGKFLEDSIQIGLSVFYTLSLRHPKDLEVFFPDSSFNFTPFELVNKRAFDTQTKDNTSLDSVVYELTTFEILPVQKLQLPIFILEKDTINLYPAEDSVLFQALVKGNIDKLQFKENITRQNTSNYFNYPYWILGIVITIIFLWLLWQLIGTSVRRNFKLYNMRIRHGRFSRDFNRLTNRITRQRLAKDIEKALGIWKNYLEYLEEEPISTYTSKEISQIYPQEKDLGVNLKNIDKAIYGKLLSEEIVKSLDFLRNFSVIRYSQKQEEIRNAQ